MTAPTVAVTVRLSSMEGVPYPNTVITAKLDKNDIYQGFVISQDGQATTDVNGEAVLNLFPNNPVTGLGTTGSVYKFTAQPPGGKHWRVTAQIPNQDCELDSVADLEDVPTLSAAEAALASARAAAAAAALSATQAAQSALEASQAPLILVEVSGDKTFDLTDRNTFQTHPAIDNTARSWVIPSNDEVPYVPGTAMTWDNQTGAGDITLTLDADTMDLSGYGIVTSVLIPSGEQATGVKVSATLWRINGTWNVSGT